MAQTEQQLAREVSLKRRAWAEQSLFNWVSTYLVPPHSTLCRGKFAPFHKILCGWFDEALLPGGGIIGFAPRGHAKSTICTIGGALFALLNRSPRFHKANVVIIAKNEDEAKKKLRIIVNQLERNRLIMEDYGAEAVPKKEVWKNVNVENNDLALTLANGARISIFPLMGPVRGSVTEEGERIDLVIMEDVEDEKQIKSKIYRDDAWDWMLLALLPAMDLKFGSFSMLATKIHRDSLLIRAMKHKGWPENWNIIDIPAVNARGEVLWPAERPHAILMRERGKMGPTRFGQEYLGIVMSDEDATFDKDWVRYFKRSQLEFIHGCWHINDGLTPQPRPLLVLSAHDPAFTEQERKKSDYTGSITGGYDEKFNRVYVLYVAQLKLGPVAFIKHVIHRARIDKPTEVGIESNLAQRIFAVIISTLAWISVRKIIHGSGDQKSSRVQGLAPLFESAKFWFPTDDAGVPEKGTAEFVEQLATWTPSGDEDDQLDACAMLSTMIPFPAEEDADAGDNVIQYNFGQRESRRAASGF